MITEIKQAAVETYYSDSPKARFFLQNFGIFVELDSTSPGPSIRMWITKMSAAGPVRQVSYYPELWTVWCLFEELVSKKVTVLARGEEEKVDEKA